MTTRSATVAIVGRPNVGKSTLFNRLVGRRQSIVHDMPGVTRDRVTSFAQLGERSVHLVDTGGLLPHGDALGLNDQVLEAVRESDLLLLVVDGREGLLPADLEVRDSLRRFGKPTVLVVNKGDTRAAREGHHEFTRLGIEPLVLVSAEHGFGVPDLTEAVAELIPPAEALPEVDAPRLAIVGRPNVGKSSILNRVVGSERALVSPTPGTTRDPVDSRVEHDGEPYLWVDTPGIRRRSKVADPAEDLAVMMARRQLEAADAALLVVDASAGVTTGDLAIGGAAWEMGRAVAVAVNKWDLLDEESRRRLEEGWERLAILLGDPPRVNVSARTGRGLDKLIPALRTALAGYRLTLSTARLNELAREIVSARRPPAHRGRPWKLFYATQVKTGPPTFMLFANRTLDRNSPYRRYLDNAFRRELDLKGVPVRLVIRRRGAAERT